MHIAFLTPEYPHQRFGPSAGLGTSIKNLSNSLVKRGLRVTIFVYGQNLDSDFTDKGINFKGIRQRKYKVLGWLLYRRHITHIINQAIKRDKIDLIEAVDWTGITAFISFLAPLIIRIHGSDGFFCKLGGRPQKLKNRIFEKNALKNANALVSVSEFAGKETKRVFGLVRDIEIIHNGLFLDQFQNEDRSELVKNRLLYFGTIIRKKGVLELAEIFNQVIEKCSSAELVLIGKDVSDIIEKRSTYEIFKDKLSQKAKDKIRFLGEVPYDDIEKHISSSEVIIFPSFAEALPMTWLEAMAMGRAIVTSNIGWAKEIMIDGETGFTVDPLNHKLFAQKIITLLQNKELAEKMGNSARMRVIEKFSAEKLAKKNIEFYKSAIEKTI